MDNPPQKRQLRGTANSSQQPEIRNRDMLALKRYITAKDDVNPYEDGRLNPNTLLIDLSHSNLKQRHIEIRFDRHDTIMDLRLKIHQKTGTPPHFQKLILKSSGQILHEFPASDDPSSPAAGNHGRNFDHYKLGYFFGGGSNGSNPDGPPIFLPGLEVHCVDVNPHSGSRGGQYEDTSLVEKYVMTEEQYDQRKGTLRDWGRQQKERDANFTLARHAKEHRELVEAQRQHKLGLELPPGFVLDSTGTVIRDEPDVHDPSTDDDNIGRHETISEEYDETSVAGIEVGQRCEVNPGSRRGVVSYVGLVPELPGGGYWVGVTFDEPVGKTDGSVPCPQGKSSNTKRYFTAMEQYASFIRGKNVQVGDFPERDILDELDDESDDEL
jgi:tubulin-folding cofactor B